MLNLKVVKSKVLDKPTTMAKKLAFLRTFAIYSDDPNDTVRVFNMEEMLRRLTGPEGRQRFLSGLKKLPGPAQMLQDRYLAPKYDLADLKDCAPGTLGAAYYRHMTSNGFTPDFFPAVEQIDEISYFTLRMRQTHDIWHVVTGYGVDIPSEIALQAFYLGQAPGGLSALLIAGAILHITTRTPQQLTVLFDGITEGWERGKAARPLHPYQWEKMWNRPLTDLQAELNIQPIRELALAA